MMPRLAILQHAALPSTGTCVFDAGGFCKIQSHYDLVPYEPPVLSPGAPEPWPVHAPAPETPLSEDVLRAALWESCDQKYFIAAARLHNLISVPKLLALLEKK